MVAEVDANTPDRWGAFVDRAAKPVSGDGPLAGLRLAVKDNIAVAGAKWTAGLPLLADRVAEQDAACVAVLRAAGACVVGTTATDAAGFGMMTPGVVNPLAPDRTAGGSSGGSAAAVAAGLADIALGTDTAGSVRVPAACCGLYGLKPTFGRISVEGVTPLSLSFDHVGMLSGSLDAMERTLDVLLAGRGEPAPHVSRIGFDPGRLMGADLAIRDAIERTLAWLSSQGYALVEVELPDRIELAEMHGAIVCAEALSIWSEHWPHDSARFADTARRSLAYAGQVPADEIAEARAKLPVARARIEAAMAGVDLLLGPTIAVPPPPVGARRVAFCGGEVPVVLALLAETCPFNIGGQPALSMPLPWLDRGIPISLQIAARHDGERAALALARKLDGLGSAA
jgi:Asp-tRNA(Asn)/Glu-tRNA(Gln) amidotransferase A subunit family amidase